MTADLINRLGFSHSEKKTQEHPIKASQILTSLSFLRNDNELMLEQELFANHFSKSTWHGKSKQ